MKFRFIIKLAFKNLKRYKLRTFLTAGGVAISIGFISFLTALGYGLQKVSTDQIANMEALQILDVDTGKSKIVAVNEEAVRNISNLFGVEKVYPMVSVAGDLSLQGSKVDGIVYGKSQGILEIEKPNVIVGKSFTSDSAEEVLVNIAAAKKLGVANYADLVGRDLTLNMVLRPELIGGDQKVSKRETRKYRVAGILEEGNSPYVYLPLNNFKALGVTSYSGAKVKTTSRENVDKIKVLIEHMGFKVSSIKDTIDQVNQFFGVFRMVLTGFGVIAVIVSCIGMFNTLTISLIEKTREIGIMKSLGTTKKDIKRIFISEALLIGMVGGVTGIAVSMILGEIFNASIYALANSTGNTPVKIFIFPPELLIVALVLSVLISFLTGAYPSRRASRISALNALRYE
ncbi:MAG: ABC transporter permease [bacterium]|nr:ABC transporter permease [bacterium]